MKTNKFKQKQKGVALAIGILLLLVVSMIGITSMKSALLQEKMAASLKNREYADAAAIALLRAGERYLNTFYITSNGTNLSPGIGPVVSPRSDIARKFRSKRDLSTGFTHPFGVNLMDFFRNGALNNVLKQEPMFIIEDIESVTARGPSALSSYLDTTGETDDGSAGSNSGQNADSGTGSGIGRYDVKKYRIISKATDSTGNLYVGFESVVSVMF